MGTNSFHILILEDDPLISEHLGALVERLIASRVTTVSSVSEAGIASEDKVDFAFLDVDVLDGTTYGFALRLADRGIPFAFISASDRDKLPTRLRSARFVSKPYEEQQIVALLEDWQRPAARQTR